MTSRPDPLPCAICSFEATATVSDAGLALCRACSEIEADVSVPVLLHRIRRARDLGLDGEAERLLATMYWLEATAP